MMKKDLNEERFVQKEAECASTPAILDSGNRREFKTGAVRDIQNGKGRCDLLPLDVVGFVVRDDACMDEVINEICRYAETEDVTHLRLAIRYFCAMRSWSVPEAMLEVSKHFEEGCKKYGERNWERGIPESCFIDSAIRHYLKWLDSWVDEPHDRAVLWNLMCLWWTHIHITEAETNDD